MTIGNVAHMTQRRTLINVRVETIDDHPDLKPILHRLAKSIAEIVDQEKDQIDAVDVTISDEGWHNE